MVIMVIIATTIWRMYWAHFNGEWVSGAGNTPGVYLKEEERGGWMMFWISLGFCLLIYKLSLNISISQASWRGWDDAWTGNSTLLETGQETERGPRSMADFSAWVQDQVYPESEAQEADGCVFRRITHKLLQSPGEKARRPVAPFCLICLTAPASEASDRDFGQIYVLSQRSVGKAIGKGLLTETCEVASGGQENRRKLASHAIWVPLWQPPEITVGDFNGGGGRQSCYVR